jgi:4-hydroxy-2-oxoheptanedioate aldolase
MHVKELKQRLRAGETLIGCWLNLGSALTAEIVGLAGYDWVLIDLEHGAGSDHDVLAQLLALERTPAATIVRTESCERQRTQRALDLGAEGIMFPRVTGFEEARQAVRAIGYPPDGTRGVAAIVRATGFGPAFPVYRARAGENLLGIIQVETVEILDHLGEIAALDGVDALFIGPADLSMALGEFGGFDHPRFVEAVDATVRAAHGAGKAAGIYLPSPSDLPRYQEMGIRLFGCGVDAAFVLEGARSMASRLRESAGLLR